jgi:dihydrofolate reductase
VGIVEANISISIDGFVAGPQLDRYPGLGASIIQQALAAGLVDELFLHVAPVILTGGTRLFDNLTAPIRLGDAEVIESARATHLRYQVKR